MELYEHQKSVLEQSTNLNKVAYYYDMGLGKTFIGSEKLKQLNEDVNIVVCQSSKIDDWINHFITYYDYKVYSGQSKTQLAKFIDTGLSEPRVLVISYDTLKNRPELQTLKGYTLMLDESSLICNEKSKRAKSIMKLRFKNLILLSGTPTAGRYEKLYSQLKLLGMKMGKTEYWNNFIVYRIFYNGVFEIKLPTGHYKNVHRLVTLLKEHGCFFKKTEDVIDLPEQQFIEIKCKNIPEYKKFKKDRIVSINDTKIIGDCTLSKMLGERQLAGVYNKHKLSALKDLIDSTEDRLIIFYTFNAEKDAILSIIKDRPVSICNGSSKDLTNFRNESNAILLGQYQACSMGLNLQECNKIIYFTPTLQSDLYEQSKKRIHRIGTKNTCFYYQLVTENSIESKIYEVLALKQDYTERLFEDGARKNI